MDNYVLFVASGKGSRMNADLPKQFLELNSRPVLMHTFDAFSFLLPEVHFVLVLEKTMIGHWNKLCSTHDFSIKHQIVEGGPKRFHSVKAGLNLVPDGVLVAIHDGVRPLVSKQSINNCFMMAERKGNAIPVVSINESVRMVDHQFSKPINRDQIRLVQTPQTFQSTMIKEAYKQNYKEGFTDDASVLENLGTTIHLVDGNLENIKITTLQDLKMASSLLGGGK